MSVAQKIEYPESDGKPMGETDLHIDWIIRIRDMLKLRYRGQRVYVGNDLLVYYQQGDPKQFVVPDGFVVKDCDPNRRRTFKIWEEGKVPNVVFEITSLSSRREDEIFKPKTYARIGVAEYFIYDPTSDYLQPPLQGHRLSENGEYTRIQADETGALGCHQLGVQLSLQDTQLIMTDSATGHRLLTASEAEEVAREAETVAREAADVAREAAERKAEKETQRRQAAEQEVQRLREQLKRLNGE